MYVNHTGWLESLYRVRSDGHSSSLLQLTSWLRLVLLMLGAHVYQHGDIGHVVSRYNSGLSIGCGVIQSSWTIAWVGNPSKQGKPQWHGTLYITRPAAGILIQSHQTIQRGARKLLIQRHGRIVLPGFVRLLQGTAQKMSSRGQGTRAIGSIWLHWAARPTPDSLAYICTL